MGRRRALAALADIDDPRATPVLLAAIDDRNERIAAAAVKALVRTGDQTTAVALLPLLLSEPAWRSEQAERALNTLDRNWPASAAARELAPGLVALLGSEDPAMRVRAVVVMGAIGDPEFTDPLLHALVPDDPAVAAAAASALADLGEARAVEPTVEAIERVRDELDFAEREAIILALGRLGGPRALAVLLSMSAPKQAPGRKAAIAGLGYLDDEQAVDRLLAIVAAERDAGYDDVDFLTAVRALGRIRIPDPSRQQAALEALESLLLRSDDHWAAFESRGGNTVRLAANWALRERGDHPTQPIGK